MSNLSNDHPSIRVFAPPGGRSTNIFGVQEPDQPISNKKNYMESDIFGCKKDNTDSAPAKPARSMTNNIFGTETNQSVPKASIYSDKNKSTIFDEAPPQQPSNKPDRQRSNIFGANEPAQSGPTRPVSDRHKSNIFSVGDDEQTKRQQGTRQGLRVGYNPINGEAYSTKNGLNSKVEGSENTENDQKSDNTVETPEEPTAENGHDQPVENGNDQVPTNTTENGHSNTCVDKPANGHDNVTNGNGVVKNVHTGVRVFHPPGGKSNGPLW